MMIASIEMDTSIQCRANIDIAVVNDYAERMTEGDAFPPVELYGTKDKCWIGDGWHRVLAAQSCGFLDIEANLHKGGRIDALKAALSANGTNGLRRTNADKRRCIEIAMKEWPKLSDRAIAEMCGVGHPLVAASRPIQLEEDSSSKRLGRDGKERPAKRTTVTKPEPEEEPEPTKETPRKVGPPRNGMQFARIAIMNLEEITEDDVERTEAFAMVEEWLNEHT